MPNQLRRAWRYHAEYEPKIFEGDAIDIAERAGWVDSPAKVEPKGNEDANADTNQDGNMDGGDANASLNNLGENDENSNEAKDNEKAQGSDEAKDNDENSQENVKVDYTDSKWTKKLLKAECITKGIDYSHLGSKPKNDELIALLEG